MEEGDIYWLSFLLSAVLCCILQYVSNYLSSNSSNSDTDIEEAKLALMGVKEKDDTEISDHLKFKSFQRNYLFVFVLAMFSDWLQGPYVYELYVSYGFDQAQIAELFVCGFGSSMILGTFVGGLADSMGRKKMCILYSICYIIACLTKLVNNYSILMVGRFLSGVSTSLLFSVFESWMVCEHNKNNFDGSLLGDTFSYATFANGLVAVIAGLVANWAASFSGPVAPFVVAIVPLTLVAMTVSNTWSENYGNQQVKVMTSFAKGWELIKNDRRIAALGIGQSCFEGAMYTFVFMWTPALKKEGDENDQVSLYLGLIFAVFMVCVMIGSSVFKLLSTDKASLYKLPLYMHMLSFASMAAVTTFMDNKNIVYLAFLVFETTVGMFYPAYGVIKSEIIPEEIRSSVMNLFRIPLNAFVVLLLLKIKFFTPSTVFSICTLTHFVSLCSYGYFYSSVPHVLTNEDKRAIKEEQHKIEALDNSPNRIRGTSIGRETSELEMYLRESKWREDS